MFKDPIKWAVEASKKGFGHALGITNSNKVQFFVTAGGTIPNKMSAFWTNAHHWLLKRCPAQELETLKQKQAASQNQKAAANGQ